MPTVRQHLLKMSKSKPSVLVLLATGKLGSGVVDAFAATGNYKIYGTSRNAQHPKLVSKAGIVTPIAPFFYGDQSSIEKALTESKPQVVVVITTSIVSKTREQEVQHGRLILDACKSASIPHVILTSNELADVAPKEAGHLSSKKELENYIQGLGLPCYSILRPSSFMENFDDPTVMNPLCRGSLKDLYDGQVRVNHVATLDVGKAAVVMAENAKQWNGKTLACITSRDTGDELTLVLSDVSGIPCTYQAAPPHLILRFLLKNLYHMVELCRTTSETADWSKEIKEFRLVVPDAMDFRQWLETQQKGWSDGTLFGEPAPKTKSHWGQILTVAGVVVLALLVANKSSRIS